MIVTSELVRGEGKTVVFELSDKDDNPVLFADLLDVQVEILINKVSQGIYKKIDPAADFGITAVVDEAAKCKILLLPDQTVAYPKGLLELKFTMVLNDADYASGRPETEFIQLYKVV